MRGKVNPVPEGYHSVTPYLIVHDADQAISYYRQVFGAIERFRMKGPDGRVGHAELLIGNSHVMLADEFPEKDALCPWSMGGSPVSLMVYLEDVDATVERAVAAGATLTQAPEDKFYGDRMGGITDPFGHQWCVATHVEDVPPEELQRRAAALPS